MSVTKRDYIYSVKQYSNSADGVRYNVSFSRPQIRKNRNVERFYSAVKQKSVFPVLPHPRPVLQQISRRYRLKRVGKLRTDYEKDRSNVLRAIREIRNIGLSNDWDYFVTFTIDPKLHDRTDYCSVAKKMTQYFRNLRKQGYDIEYLLIPELHKDYVNYHFHGLIRGNIDSLLSPHPLKWQADKGYLDFPEFASRFGYVSLSPVKTTNFVVYYVLKYINKQFTRTKWNEGMHMYYVSRNIARPSEIKRFQFDIPSEYLANNFNYTDYGSAYFRGLTEDQVFESEMQFLFEDCYYSQQEIAKEIFV